MYHAFDGALPPYLRCRSYVDTVLEASGGGSQLCLAESSWGMVDHPLGVRLGIQGKKMWDGCGLQEEDSDSEDSSSSSSSSDDDRDFSSAGWRELHSIIQSALTLGMAGLPFTCPGPAGGLPKPPKTPRLGSAVQHKNNSDVDPELLVRQAQAMALLPMMRIGVAPWRQLDATYLDPHNDASKKHRCACRWRRDSPFCHKHCIHRPSCRTKLASRRASQGCGNSKSAMCQVCAALGIQKRSSYGPEEGGRFMCFEHREPGDVRRC